MYIFMPMDFKTMQYLLLLALLGKRSVNMNKSWGNPHTDFGMTAFKLRR